MAAEPSVVQSGLPAANAGEAWILLGQIAVALNNSNERLVVLRRADSSVANLRVWLRLGEDVGWLSAGGRRHAIDAVDEIGRMIGGRLRSLASGDVAVEADAR